MRLFIISGKFQQRGVWSNRDADFTGYFVKKDGSEVIEGYMEELYPTPFDRIRYVKGLYIEDKNQLTFVKMTNNEQLQPLAYTFPNLAEKGFWSGYNFRRGFFHHDTFEGHATVVIEEVCGEEKQRLVEKTQQMFAKCVAYATRLNKHLLENVEPMRDFLVHPPRH